jgi:diazepam-binding inhibitor (GABA receptor modulating acyl-CoA-binding protein)
MAIQARYKYKAWKELVDQGMKPAEAQAKYIAFVEELKPKYHYDPNKVPE